MNDAGESPFKKAQDYNFDNQEALGKELRDYSLKLAQASGVPKNLPRAMQGLAAAYFMFRNDDSLEYLVDLLEQEIDENRPVLHGVDLRTLAEELKSLETITKSVRLKIKEVESVG